MTKLSQSNTVRSRKSELRKIMLARRAAMGSGAVDRVSRLICRYLAEFLRQNRISTVFMYLPVRLEVDARYLLNHIPHIKCALPVTKGDAMDFYPWTSATPLQEGRFGIVEPVPTGVPLQPDAATAILVPSLAVSHQGVRLGYGGGYFDRYLSRFPALAIALLADQFLVPTLPRETFDFLVDFVATESGVQRLRR